jgi:HSP20 family molecular chaperone IbpA
MSETNTPVKAPTTNAADTRETTQTLEPAVDIFEVNEGLVVVADLPGVDKDNVDVRVENGLLTIEGKTHADAPGEPLFGEFRLLNFYRQFRLSEEVDQDNIKADMKYGVLTIQLPQAEKAKPKRIDVKIA